MEISLVTYGVLGQFPTQEDSIDEVSISDIRDGPSSEPGMVGELMTISLRAKGVCIYASVLCGPTLRILRGYFSWGIESPVD